MSCFNYHFSNTKDEVIMGCCFTRPQSSPKPPPNKARLQKQQPQTHRILMKEIIAQKKQEQSECIRTSNNQFQSNSSVRQTKNFFKNGKSTALFSSDRSHSSILQLTIDHENMIVRDDATVQQQNKEKQYYVIAERVALLKKTGDQIKVSMPDGQSQINCGPQHLFTCLTVSEGRPADCLEEVEPNKFIYNEQSPILLKIWLQCQNCRKQLKISFCKAVADLKEIECPSCDCKGSWNIQDIECNYPIWGQGKKIDNHQPVQPAPARLRVMGCVKCFRFTKSDKMQCGCLICPQCIENQKISLKKDCWMCQGSSSYLLP